MYFLNLSTFSNSNSLGTLNNLMSLKSQVLSVFGSNFSEEGPTKNAVKGIIASKSKKQEPFK